MSDWKNINYVDLENQESEVAGSEVGAYRDVKAVLANIDKVLQTPPIKYPSGKGIHIPNEIRYSIFRTIEQPCKDAKLIESQKGYYYLVPKQTLVNEKGVRTDLSKSYIQNKLNQELRINYADDIYKNEFTGVVRELILNESSALRKFLVATYIAWSYQQDACILQPSATKTGRTLDGRMLYNDINALLPMRNIKVNDALNALVTMFKDYFLYFFKFVVKFNRDPSIFTMAKNLVCDSTTMLEWDNLFPGNEDYFIDDSFIQFVGRSNWKEIKMMTYTNQLINALMDKAATSLAYPKLMPNESISPESIVDEIYEIVEKSIDDISFPNEEQVLNAPYSGQFSGEKHINLLIDAIDEVLSLDIWNFLNKKNLIKHVSNYMIVEVPPENQSITDIVSVDGYNRATFDEFDIRGDMREASNNIYYLQDYNWSMSKPLLDSYSLSMSDFQKLNVYELQPDRQVSKKGLVHNLISELEGAKEGIKGALDSYSKNNGSNAFASTLAKALNKVANIAGDTLGVAGGQILLDAAYPISAARKFATNTGWIENLCDGYWVGQYELPYFGNKFMHSDTAMSWALGDLLTGRELIQNQMTMSVMDIPQWKFTPLNSENNEITVPIILLNETYEDVLKNFKFLFALSAGAFWVKDSQYSYRSPNLYRIICPGRFVMLYAGMSITASYLGKIRRYKKEDANKIFSTIQTIQLGKSTDSKGYTAFNKFLNGEADCSIPEAIMVSIKFKDITPAAFNIHAAYFNNVENTLIPNISYKQIASDYQKVNVAAKLGL